MRCDSSASTLFHVDDEYLVRIILIATVGFAFDQQRAYCNCKILRSDRVLILSSDKDDDNQCERSQRSEQNKTIIHRTQYSRSERSCLHPVLWGPDFPPAGARRSVASVKMRSRRLSPRDYPRHPSLRLDSPTRCAAGYYDVCSRRRPKPLVGPKRP